MKKLSIVLACIGLIFLSSMSFVRAQDCEEQWVCKAWSSCKDGLKTRTCTDKNECGTELYKPFESEPCSEGEAAITGTNVSVDMLFVAVFIVVLIVGIYGIFLYRRRKK
ncbi:MAG: hypothetical protein JSW73_02685 [Candidatus Woesearchaeota archaeon]|nr:MAG: hypothetical protein JSW73_02685 [Candidatus Woesearchaeota archaeon]